MTVILFVRHTEVHNPDGLLYGRLPGFRLSETGRQHAERVADALASREVVAIYSSPLLRARQTSAIVAARFPGATIHQSALLTEVGSAWQGSPLRPFASGFNTYHCRKAPDDESLEDIRARMLAFVRRAGRRYPESTIVAVSHGDPITILRVALKGLDLTVLAIRGDDYAPLGSITEVRVDPDDGRAWVERAWTI